MTTFSSISDCKPTLVEGAYLACRQFQKVWGFDFLLDVETDEILWDSVAHEWLHVRLGIDPSEDGEEQIFWVEAALEGEEISPEDTHWGPWARSVAASIKAEYEQVISPQAWGTYEALYELGIDAP